MPNTVSNNQIISATYVALFQRAPDQAGLKVWQDEAARLEASGEQGIELAKAMATQFAQHPAFTTLYGGLGNAAFIDAIYVNIGGKVADTAGRANWLGKLTDTNNPITRAELVGEFIYGVLSITSDEIQALDITAQEKLDGQARQDRLTNKAEVALEFTKALGNGSNLNPATDANSLESLQKDPAYLASQAIIAGVTEVDATKTAPLDYLDGAPTLAGINAQFGDNSANNEGQTFKLTQNADNFTGGAGDDVFTAPVTQNTTGSGVLANTFETGDVLDGGAGRNVLNADLIDSGSVSDGSLAPAISATTRNIQEVYLRAQSPQNDGSVNSSTIDAENMQGVEQWWTSNSRSNIQIEDIRTDTAATTFGMRLTDPGVGYNAYFNALFLEGDATAVSALTLNLYQGPLGAPNAVAQLQNISVFQINFTIGGVAISLASPAIQAANTWDELETALNAELVDQGLDADITLVNRGNGQFVFEDSEGRPFQVATGGTQALVLGTTNNITVTNSLTVGREEVTGPIQSSAVLDGAGNGSQGGALNLGAMSGLRGVEELDLVVDRDSHLTSITSFNRVPGEYGTLRNGDANQFLEVVDVSSMGANGDLTVGRSTANLDGRVATWSNTAGVATAGTVVVLPPSFTPGNSGFLNLRELNAKGFAGEVNVAVTLDNNAINRYLSSATEPVVFSYNGGNQDDTFNIADVSTAGRVSGDADFAMEVDMGAGDDRLVINVPTVSAVSVDGGTGENSIAVSQSHGTTAANTFAGFDNFQTYEVEAGINTVHDFTSMSGVEEVVIATQAGGFNTQLIDLEATQNVTVSGKNQTLGNNSANDQDFGTIRLTNDAGVNRTITLENTARLSNDVNGVRQDGVLTVQNLLIDTNPATGVGATRNVTIESEGVRDTANAIEQFNGRDVETLTLTGTQDLTINVNQIADQAANAAPGTNTSTSVRINAAGLDADLNLAVNGTMLNNFGGVPPMPAQVDTIVGTTGSNDNLMFYGALNAGNAVNASGFESVQLGSFANTVYGDLVINQDASGTLNTGNLGVSQFEVANLNGTLGLTNLASGASVDMGDANRDANGNRVLSQTLAEQINLQSSALTAGTTAGTLNIDRLDVIATNTVSNINVGDSVVGSTANTGGFRTINLNVARDANLLPAAFDNNRIDLDVGSQARTLNVTGGQVARSNVAAQPAQAAVAETQTLDFTGPVTTVAGSINVGGITVALAAGDTDAQVAGKVLAALNAAPAGTAIGDATYAVAGAVITANFAAADGDVPGNALAVVDAGAILGAAPVNTTTVPGATGIIGSLQVADVLNLAEAGNELDNSLEVINLSGYNGQVTLIMESVVTGAQTDVNFVMSAYSANIDLTDMGGGGGAIALIAHNSVFEFTGAGSVQVPSVWTIEDIVNGGAAGAGVNNNTVFDLGGLGIANYAGVEVLYVNDGDIATDLAGNTLAAGTAVIRSETQGNNNAETWEIIVTAVDGVALTGANPLTVDNFAF